MELDPTLAGVLIAGFGAILAYLVARRGAQVARIQADVTLAQTRLASEQTQLAAGEQVSAWFEEFRAWASEAIDVLSEAVYECPPELADVNETTAACVRRLRHRLSSLIDRGRLFLPNVEYPGVGQDKPAAYSGFRHEALDPLVAAERVLSGEADTSDFPSRTKALIHTKRVFVTRVQEILQPRAQNEQIAALITRSRGAGSSDAMIAVLLPSRGTIPSGAEAILRRPPSGFASPLSNER
jgi:hypothetical protein